MRTSSPSRRWPAPATLLAWLGVAGLALAFGADTPRRFVATQLADAGLRAPARLAAAPRDSRPAAGPVIPREPHPRNADPLRSRDASGELRTWTPGGRIDHDNAFFQSLGSNGRACSTCHVQEAGWTITPPRIQARFAASDGRDPLFRPNDGAVSPLADTSTLAARRRAYALLLQRGLIRVGMPIPANAEFTLVDVDDPYHYASATELSLFRRPLPSTNLGFVTGVMWDGREGVRAFLPPMDPGQAAATLQASLVSQARNATLGHAQATTPPTDAQLADIVAFESSLSTAQVRDDVAGLLNSDGALGGPHMLAHQRFFVGINDTLGADPTGALFNQGAMDLFAGWRVLPGHSPRARARAAIARGEQLFNHAPLHITHVGGLNDALGIADIPGTCTSCHNAPNVGNHTVSLPLDLGITDAARRRPDMPLYTLRNKHTGALVRTSDPGLALVTGRWKDIGKFKGPILRGLAARPPYFHDGSAASLREVIDFYDQRFAMHLRPREKADLAAFLAAL